MCPGSLFMRMGKDAGRGGDGMLKLVRYKTGGASNEDQQRKNLHPLRPLKQKCDAASSAASCQFKNVARNPDIY